MGPDRPGQKILTQNEANCSELSRILAKMGAILTEKLASFDQGMTFFLPNMTWLQPPAHVHSMISRGGPWATGLGTSVQILSAAAASGADPPCPLQPCPAHPGRKFCPSSAAPNQCDHTTPTTPCPPCKAKPPPAFGPSYNALNITASAGTNGSHVAIRLVNPSTKPVTAKLGTEGLRLRGGAAAVATMAGGLRAANPASNPDAISPAETTVTATATGLSLVLPPQSFTVIHAETAQ